MIILFGFTLSYLFPLQIPIIIASLYVLHVALRLRPTCAKEFAKDISLAREHTQIIGPVVVSNEL